MKNRLRALGRRAAWRTRSAADGIARAAAGLQGLAGALLVSGGVYLEAGRGWAAIVLGGFLLLGAWGRR